jgi:hypothetical protein
LNHDGKDPKKPITAFPNGFSMVAGDSARRNYSVGGLDYREPDPEKAHWANLGQTNQHDLRQRALGFNCLNYGVNKDEPTLGRHYLPDKEFLDGNCKHGVRFELSFPSCWNGKDITAPDHQSHVAYPSLVLNGDCPDGFDVKLPGLMYETIWRTQDFVGVAGEFVVSNGDPQGKQYEFLLTQAYILRLLILGFGYHGDFISGWDEKFLQAAVDQCTNPSGNIADCPLFTIQSLDEQLKCKIAPPPMVASEKLTGIIGNTLPGGVSIHRGPGPAVHNGAPPAAPAPSVETGNQHAAMVGENKLPGGVFKEAPTSTTQAPPPPPPPTAAPIPSDPPVPEGYELVRTDYVTNGGVVSKIIVIETVTYVMLASKTVTVTATVAPAEKRHAHQHLARHRRGSN